MLYHSLLCPDKKSIRCTAFVIRYTKQIGLMPPNCCANFRDRQTTLSLESGTISTL